MPGSQAALRLAGLGSALLALSACTVVAPPTQQPVPAASANVSATSASPSNVFGSPTMPQPGPTATASGMNVQPPTSLTTDGLLRLPIETLPRQWNPWLATGTDARAVTGPMTAQPFLFDASGVPRPNPDYLVAATASGTPTVAILRLNPQAVWGDGTPITASDWVSTWKAVGAGDRRFASKDVPGWDRVADVKQGKDPFEVAITYRGLVLDWTQPLIDAPARAASVADPTVFNQGWTTLRPDWFTGPYTLTHLDAKQGVITLARNPRWWGTPPPLKSIFFRVTSPDALAADVASGGFDLYPVTLANAEDLKQSSGSLRVTPGLTGRQLSLTASGPLADARVRQALVRAVDRVKLGRAAMGGTGLPATPWTDPLLLPDQPGAIDTPGETALAFDLAGAGQALTDAGFPLVDGVRRGPSGTLNVTIGVQTGGWTRSDAAALASDLNAIGVQTAMVPGQGDLTLSDVTLRRYPLIGVTGRLGSIPGLAELASAVETAPDAQARRTASVALSRALLVDARVVPVFVYPDAAITRTTLANAGASGLASVNWATIGFTS